VSRATLIHHDAAVAHNEAVRAAATARHRALVQAAARRIGDQAAVGVATWYGWHPGQCASPFLPHGTLLTVTDLATHKTIQCLVTDTEAHNPGRVVDLSEYCFEELAPLSQGVILVRITW
jgi:rare lipoprotein A (peptidoglycan hydrolase)